MGSLYLHRLNSNDRESLKKKLFDAQGGLCFICEEQISLELHKNHLDIDHVIPIKMEGKDDPSNFALTHDTCNRSKQASNLVVARILRKFASLKEELLEDNRGPNLDDILKMHDGSKFDIKFSREGNKISYSFPDIGNNEIKVTEVYRDAISGFEYFFAKIPIEYLHHDEKINPRSIGQNISKLLEEFYLKRPQLQVSLAWISLNGSENCTIKIFDGQHKTAAQVLLGVKEIPLRIFINPDLDILLTTNTNAGTTLKQVAFDKSVQRHLGSALYVDRVERYKKDLGKGEEDFNFSERDLVKYFKGESREMKRYILDAVRDAITHHSENKLRDYIDLSGKGKERPLSYSTVEKTFFSFFIFQEVLDIPLNSKLDTGENPRELEKEQILQLMNVIAEELLIGKYDSDLGTNRIESRIQSGENIPLVHLRAYRLCKEEILYNWLKSIQQIIQMCLITHGTVIKPERAFQYKFPETLWDTIRTYIRNFINLPVWINKEFSSTLFGGKQNYDYWHYIFENGKTMQGQQVLAGPINLMNMISE